MSRIFTKSTLTTLAASFILLTLSSVVTIAANLKLRQIGTVPASQTFKAPAPVHQKVIEGCEDDVTQTSYDGPCEDHKDVIVIEGCHNNETQTSTPGPCPS